MKFNKPAIFCLPLMLIPGLSVAYVGPGVGLSALGSILAFIGAIFLMIVGFLWYPIKRLIKGRKEVSPDTSKTAPAEIGTDADASDARDDGKH